MTEAARRARLAALVRDVPGFPSAGIVFRDIGPLLADAAGLAQTVDALTDCAAAVTAGGVGGVDVVAGIEARGFVLGAPLAVRLGVGFVPVRKAGKLPRPALSATYDLEYGTATLEVQQDGLTAGARVLVVDDVLATGGTAAATVDLVRRAGAQPVGVVVLAELAALGGRAVLAGLGVEVASVLVF